MAANPSVGKPKYNRIFKVSLNVPANTPHAFRYKVMLRTK